MNKNMYEIQDELKEKTLTKMRKIFLFLVGYVALGLLLFLCSCNREALYTGAETETPVKTETELETEIIEDLPEPENKEILFALNKGFSFEFYDGDKTIKFEEGKRIIKVGNKLYSSDNVLNKLNNFGQIIQKWNLVTDNPEIIRVNGNDIWISITMSKEDSIAEGLMAKERTKIYKNATEFGRWQDREYVISDMKILNNEVFVKTTLGTWHGINNNKKNIKNIETDHIVHDLDINNFCAKFNNTQVSWTTNFFNGASQWLKSENKWYSENGFVWDGEYLLEDGSSMKDFKKAPFPTTYTEGVVMLKVGTSLKNGELCGYWIECNSGWIVEYVPSINQYSLKFKIYNGDGKRSSGLFYKNLLNPIIIGEDLFYIWDANYYKHNLINGITSHFSSHIVKIEEF